MKKLSVITINYNNSAGLEKTIKSVINQDFDNIEYIVIDGASTDDSVKVIEKYADKITYWVSEPDSGVYNAMNKGIKAANGEYVTFINSGDILLQDIDFNKAIAHIEGEDIIYFDLEIRNEDNTDAYIKTYSDHPDFYYFATDSLPHAGAFIKREQLVQYGYYNEDFKIVSDWAFFMDSILKNNATFKHVNESYVIFFTNGISSLPESQKLIHKERSKHIEFSFPAYYKIYTEWYSNMLELYKIKTSFSVKLLKKVGFLKWLKL
ncbi:glycosyltransferase family 2 protein [Dysgonomonas sp. 25]|uniref:glycosyltransferase family 2 protein n=1 Tax=Dysgonomonas sp. 25 TaxID=2302933 RepID=UPI0013D7BCE5|nr:glycosyltransferase family 2 protein [Dysgonomonas sp. 25]NDV69036.1 glycosyltransferase [Dysgonomonas sp. 25]